MSAEYGTSRIVQIRIRIITGCFDDLFLIMAGSISIQGTDKLS